MLSPLHLRSACIFVLTFSIAGARTIDRTCGSEAGRARAHLAEHRKNGSGTAAIRSRSAKAAAAANVFRRAGELVMMDEAEGVVSQPNPFTLDQKTLRFIPASGGYRFEVGEASFDESLAGRSARVTLSDDDSTVVVLPFAFPFYGRTYERVFLNSDGNLSFERGDNASLDRSLGRLTAGQPRIAGFYTDLDPSVNGQVLTFSDADRLVVTWSRVPEYRAFGIGAANTFQVTLYRDGRIAFAYNGVNTPTGVVGISKGRLEGEPAVVAFSEGSTSTYASTVAERFTRDRDIDLVSLGQRFYRNLEDTYDYLVVYNTLGISAGTGVVAFEITVRNEREGYGDVPVDTGAEYGSKKRLQAVINMGPLSQYPLDPNGRVPSRGATGDTPLSIIGHEMGHLFLAYASVRDAVNPVLRPMLSSDGAHWNFTFNSEASLLEGNRWRDRGAGVSPRFESVATVEGYSPLDQYLMGWRAPGEVPPTFLITNAPFGFFSPLPLVGAMTDGQRRDIAIEELIAAEGRRTPDHTVAQRRFRAAFIVLTPAGAEATPEQLGQVERYRAAFEAYFDRISGGRARMETTIKRALQPAVSPAVGVVAGESASIRIDTSELRLWPRAVRVESDSSVIDVPQVVMIGPDSASTMIPMKGVRPGVATLTAAVADSDEFERAELKIAVAESRAALRPLIVSGEQQAVRAGLEPIVVRAADINKVAYPGVRITAEATGGTVSPASALAGPDGQASFVFTSSTGGEVRFGIEGSLATARAVALGRPVVGRVVDAASFQPGLATGGLATIFGSNLATAGTGAEVLINGRNATVIYADDRQINFVIPRGLAPGDYTLTVRTTEGTSEPVRIYVDVAWPALFSATDQGVDRIAVYGTGFGVDPLIATATVGGQPATVLLAGPLNQFGVTEVILERPSGVRGPQPVRLRIGQRESNTIQVLLP